MLTEEQIKFWDEHNKMQSKKYYEKNKDKVLQKKKEYREQHKPEMNAKARKYYEDHKEELKVKDAAKRIKHKDKIGAEEICICGSTIRHDHMKRHLNTKKHKDYVAEK